MGIYIAFCAACLIAAGLFTVLFRSLAILSDKQLDHKHHFSHLDGKLREVEHRVDMLHLETGEDFRRMNKVISRLDALESAASTVTPEAEDDCEVFVARDNAGGLYIYEQEPEWKFGQGWFQRSSGEAVEIPSRWFPSVKPGECVPAELPKKTWKAAIAIASLDDVIYRHFD